MGKMSEDQPPIEISFPAELPISNRVDDIAAAIRDHQVVVVAGETGSGKTTQLPKVCLQLGRKQIGHTQPRRIAARNVADRVAEELHTTVGDLVGYQVRFTRKSSRRTRLKVMTDGVLLAEISHDRDLRRYDTIIIDEAHERSLNIDFLLGYLKQLLRRRPDLKVIITSATIDTARFAEHFDDAPVIEVSGRSYPVELRYRPLLAAESEGDRAEDRDQVEGICAAVTELRTLSGRGDILVFLSGEREIRDTAEALAAMKLPEVDVLPLYARLSAVEQQRVFGQHTGQRIVLSTNVAETSLTVPGIRYVVDAGTARISRYSARTKVQRLPIEPISRASANQRAGRCGRVAPGVCIRLYSEEDHLGRPEFTEPEILRTNLASVILQMTDAGLGDIAAFPFVEPPDATQITDGLRLLDELGALASAPKPGSGPEPGGRSGRRGAELTPVGRRLARVPLDPRMGRMLLAGGQYGCLREMLIIVSGLSIPDPRERPAEKQQAADEQHRRFWAPLTSGDREPERTADGAPKREQLHGKRDEQPRENDGSDFVALLRLWDYLKDQQRELSGNAFRRMCRAEYLHFLRIREWQDLHAQLRDICRELDLERNKQPAGPDAVHTAVLSGLLSHVGLADLKEERKKKPQPGKRRQRSGPREYLGARGTKFAINPGSSVAKIQPELVMAAEVVETTRLWARTVAGIDAATVEEVGGHLLKRNHSEPHWSSRQGAVLAFETVSLYGVPIISRRKINYGRVDPVLSREIFIRSALVEGDWRTRHHFDARNREVRQQAEELEERTRRRDIVVDDQVIFDFYDRRLPTDVVSAAHFDSWWKKERHQRSDLLDLKLDDLIAPEAGGLDAGAFPDTWTVGEHTLDVAYAFDPGTGRDGVSVEVPVQLLNQVAADQFSWQVPGLRTETATELIRSLPKQLRTNFVPAPEFARRGLQWIDEQGIEKHADAASASFPAALGRALTALTGVRVTETDWQPERVPDHLRVTFVVVDETTTGREPVVLGEDKDLAALTTDLAPAVADSLNTAAAELVRTGATRWEFGTLARSVTLDRGGRQVIGHASLVDEGSSVGLSVLDTVERQRVTHPDGLRRLVLLALPDPTKWVVGHLSNTDKLALGHSPYVSVPALLADVRLASVGFLTAAATGDWWVDDEAAFDALCLAVRTDAAERMRRDVATTAEILRRHQAVQLALSTVRSSDPRVAEARQDVTEPLGNLVFPGFVAATGEPWFGHLARYLRAVEQRLATLATNPDRDAKAMDQVVEVEDAYALACANAPPGRLPPALSDVGWQLEEFRVSLFAQQLGTSLPVSSKRVLTAIRRAHGA